MRFVVALFGACPLRAVMAAANKLPLEQVADLRVGEVNVVIADGRTGPGGGPYVVAPKVKAAVERQFAPRFKGTTPVRIEVTVKRVRITSEVQTVFLAPQGMTVDITMVDPRTKAVLLTYDAQSSPAGGGGGVGGLILDRAMLPHPIDSWSLKASLSNSPNGCGHRSRARSAVR